MRRNSDFLFIRIVIADLEKTAHKAINAYQDQIENIENVNPFDGVQQLQVHGNVDDLKLKEHELRLKGVESIQQDVEGLHDLYTQLHLAVGEQGESVDHIEENVNVTQENVDSALKQLVKAHK